MLSLFFCMVVVPSFGGLFDGLFDEDIVNFEKVFERDEIIERQNNPKINTIIDEFMVFFDLECLAEKKSLGRNIIGEFMTEFPCYELNEEKEDKFPEIMDQWIVVNKKNECNNDDDKKIIWNDFCVTNVEENEIWQEYKSYPCDGCACLTRTVSSDLLWSLDDACPDYSDKVNYMNIESQSSDPNFDIIVIDGAGILSTHNAFTGINITQIYDATNGDDISSEHATFIAGVIAGYTTGVVRLEDSPYIKLIDVRTNGTSVSEIISGFDAIIDYLNNTGRKAIINLSFGQEGSGKTSVINRIETIYNLNGLMIAAAGNLNISSNDVYPASSPYTISVGNHQSNLLRASSSNYDADIYAPGQYVYSTTYTSNSAKTLGSGTSYAAPFVTGVAANILLSNPDYDLDDLLEKLLDYAAYDVSDEFGNTDLPRVQISCDEYATSSNEPTNAPSNTCSLTLDYCLTPSDGWTLYYECSGQSLYQYWCPDSANTPCVNGTGFDINDNSRGCTQTFSTNTDCCPN
mmetsp:Transcript_44442/g.39678  ORF Transcript_44442/g.39678 Transcript_44442/m.39678 type:complete len:517 (-) Transcript_44442:46-1596(-)